MSLKYRDVTGKETPIAGLNGLSGELIPSVSKYQSGTVENPVLTPQGSSRGYASVTITLPEAMPDNDYVVVVSRTNMNWADTDVQVSQSKTTTQFTLLFSSVIAITAGAFTVKWQAFKLMTDAALLSDEAKIAQNASDIAELKSSINNVARYELPNSVYNSDVVTPGSTGASTTIQSYGKIRIIEGGGVPFKTVGNKANVTILTLPSGYRPKYKTELMAMCTSGTAGAGVLRCWVDTSGIVRVWTGDTQCGGYLFISGTYIAQD